MPGMGLCADNCFPPVARRPVPWNVPPPPATPCCVGRTLEARGSGWEEAEGSGWEERREMWGVVWFRPGAVGG